MSEVSGDASCWRDHGVDGRCGGDGEGSSDASGGGGGGRAENVGPRTLPTTAPPPCRRLAHRTASILSSATCSSGVRPTLRAWYSAGSNPSIDTMVLGITPLWKAEGIAIFLRIVLDR